MAVNDGKGQARSYEIGAASTRIGFYKTLFNLHDFKMKHCIPAIVEKYDRATGMATVKPIVKFVIPTVNGEETKERPSYTVPVRRICQGGFIIDIPLFVGETGWIIASDRPCDEARQNNSTRLFENQSDDNGQNKGSFRPDSLSLSDYAWGFFIPDFWGTSEVPDDGSMVISFSPAKDDDKRKCTVKIGVDGIEVSRGKDIIKLNDDGLKYEGEPDRTVTLLSDLRYDVSTHQLQKRTVEEYKRGDFTVGTSDVSDWTMIEGGQAVEAPSGD